MARAKTAILGLGGLVLYAGTTYIAYHGYKLFHLQPSTHLPQFQEDFSKVYDHIKDYDANIELDEYFLGMHNHRKFLCSKAVGDVLEISAGTGRNIEYYDPQKLSSLLITDSSRSMLEKALIRFRPFRKLFADKLVEFQVADAEHFRVNHKFDTVIDTFGLCSHSNPIKVLADLKQICHPYGKILLLEHGRSYYDFINDILDRTALGHAKKWGCYWNRDILGLVEAAGFEIEEQERFHFGTTYSKDVSFSFSETCGFNPLRKYFLLTFIEWGIHILKTVEKVGLANSVDISSFKLQQVIGKGGFGVVRIVQKKDTKQKYALKYINKQKCIKKQSVRNIFRERVILERCDHPFIINLQFAFQDYEHMFMVLDLAMGGDLRFHLVRVGNLPNETIRLYAAEISSALYYLHTNDILHRDIKPENLLIDEMGHIHITDFNVAIMLNEKIPSSKSGTTAYMAPEMFISQPYTFSVDWWALGVVLYECTYNVHPFQKDRRIPMEKSIQRTPISFPLAEEVVVGRYPYEHDSVRQDFIAGLLNKNPKERLGCGPRGFLGDIKPHPWLSKIDWDILYRKGLTPNFIPDATQNNFDFGPALEELLYDSTPLQSKPVKKKKGKFEAPNLASLWEDEYSANKKKAAAVKLEGELDYIETYFMPYAKSQTSKDVSELMSLPAKRSRKIGEQENNNMRPEQSSETLVAPPILDIYNLPPAPTDVKYTNVGYDPSATIPIEDGNIATKSVSPRTNSSKELLPVEILDIAISDLDLDFPKNEIPSPRTLSKHISRFHVPE